MEIRGITRLVDGKEVDQFVVLCPVHNYFFNGRPPLTTGCSECWEAYYFAQTAIAGGDISQNVDQLESAIRHTAELASKGEFDFNPKLEIESIEHEN